MQGQNRMGQTLGNYRLVKLLGKGGYAEVYLAENIHLGVQTAIKVLKLRDLDDLDQEKFRSEAKFMTTLEHPHIIKVLDYGIEVNQRGYSDGSTPYIVMEYAPGGTLRKLYPHHTQMPLQEIASYTKQIAEALQYAHDKNIIHQDVKPENMLVRKPNDVALSDFGIAVSGLNTSNLQLQQAEILRKMAHGEPINIPGTAPYLAPERLQGHTRRASDQYSLAVIVYEWLAGKRPFEGSDLEICLQHEKEPPPPLARYNSSISPAIEQVIMKALAKSPDDRYKSVSDFATALDSAIQASRPAPAAFTSSIPSSVIPNGPSFPLPPVPSSTPPPTPTPRQPSLAGQQALYANNSAPPTSTPPDPMQRGGNMGNTTFVPQTPPNVNIGNPANPQWQGGTGNTANPPWQGSNMGNNPNSQWQGGTGNTTNPPWQGSNMGNNPNPQWQGGTGNTTNPPWQRSDYDAYTVENRPPGMPQPAPPPKDMQTRMEEFLQNPGEATREMFVADKYFVRTPRTRMFRMIGIPANILSALIVLIFSGFPLNIVLAIIGGALSIAMLLRCTVSVKKSIALVFGTGVALWWGIAAIIVTPPDKPAFAFIGFILALAISFGIHFWYVNTRLKR